jgi:hypothetical protein
MRISKMKNVGILLTVPPDFLSEVLFLFCLAGKNWKPGGRAR